MSKSIFVVATNGTGLYCREVRSTDTTVYSDKEVAEFDSMEAATIFMDENDHKFFTDEE